MRGSFLELSMSTLIFTTEEVQSLTGYKRPSKQLAALHSQGFSRARLGAAGNVQLERLHYAAVCAGTFAKTIKQHAPKVRTPLTRKAT